MLYLILGKKVEDADQETVRDQGACHIQCILFYFLTYFKMRYHLQIICDVITFFIMNRYKGVLSSQTPPPYLLGFSEFAVLVKRIVSLYISIYI